MLAVIKIRFSLACWLLVVAGLFAAEAVPLRKDQEKNHPTVSSYATASPAKDPRNPVKESGVSADTTRATGKEESNEEPRANAVTQEPDSGERWRSYKQKFGKKYESQEDEKSRQSIFENNFGTILSHNEQYDKGLVSFKMGPNQFTDMTQEEFSQKMNGHKQTTLTGARSSSPPSTNSNSTQQSLPSTVDWRSKGYVTAVKDQGQCASCWAFSVTGVLEGQIYRSKGLLVSLSEQNLVDCSSSYGNQGCTGGMAGYSYDYIKANGGVDTGASYPYTATQTTCRFNASNVGARVTGYVSLQYGNEQALQQAVATIGPIAIAIDANHRSFQNYQSGIYYETSCKTSVNHAVLVVGYGTLNGADYWIVKNSWGTSWGDNGYVYMSRNLNNQCGIASYSTYPTL